MKNAVCMHVYFLLEIRKENVCVKMKVEMN